MKAPPCALSPPFERRWPLPYCRTHPLRIVEHGPGFNQPGPFAVSAGYKHERLYLLPAPGGPGGAMPMGFRLDGSLNAQHGRL
jgi:hypothetical protein